MGKKKAGSTHKEKTSWTWQRPALDGVAYIFWAYAFCKLFIFDIDTYLVSLILPGHDYLIQYKFLFVLLVVAIWWLCLGTRKFLKSVAHIVFFPFVVLFWKVPRMIFGAPASVIVATLFSLGLAVKSAKQWFIGSIFFLTFCSFILIDTPSAVTAFGMLLLVAFLVMHYFSRFRHAFKPESFLRNLNEVLEHGWADRREQVLLKEYRDSSKPSQGSDASAKKRFEALKTLVFYHEFFRFAVQKLKKFHESRLLVVFSMVRLVFTFIVTVISFGFLYHGLQILDPGSFTDQTPDIFSSLYFSFNRILTMDVPGIAPLTLLARVLTVFQSIFGVLLGVVLVFVFTTIIKERHEEELGKLIERIDMEAASATELLTKEFNMSYSDVENEVREKEPTMMDTILRLREKY